MTYDRVLLALLGVTAFLFVGSVAMFIIWALSGFPAT